MAERPVLLIVDDEERILAALRRSLRREGFEIHTASTRAEALRVMDEEAPDVVISDQKMPQTSGIEILGEAARRVPQAARILITGWPESVPEADLQSIGVAALLPKPWDDAELKRILRDVTKPG